MCRGCAPLADNLNTHEPGSGVVVLGTNSTFANIGNPEKGDEFPFTCLDENGMFVQDCLPAEGTADTVDFLKFAADGSLFVSLGDGIVNSKGNWRCGRMLTALQAKFCASIP